MPKSSGITVQNATPLNRQYLDQISEIMAKNDVKFKDGGEVEGYADGGSPFYGQDAYEQLMRDIEAQKRKPLPEIEPLRTGYQGPKTNPYEPPVKDVPSTDVLERSDSIGKTLPSGGGEGDGLSGSYGLPSATPQGVMSSTTATATPSGTAPGFSFTGAPVGKVDTYDLPAPAPAVSPHARRGALPRALRPDRPHPGARSRRRRRSGAKGCALSASF
jgi:hypothetical protein